MKKLSSLLLTAVLCLLSQLAVAQEYSSTNNNKTTERNNATWYIIKNANTGEYLRYEGFKFSMTTSPMKVDGVYALDTCAMFYVTGSVNAAYIHNYAAGTQRVCVAPNKWDESGAAFKITSTTGGVFISQSGAVAASDAFHYNETTKKVDLYLGSDPNSVWVFEKITDFADIMGLNKLVNEAYDAVDASMDWGGNFWGTLDAWIDKRKLKDGSIFITPITKKSHTTLESTLKDIQEAQEIYNKYTSGYTAIFNYAEIHNKDFSTDGVTKWISTNSTSLTVNTTQTTHTNVWKIVNVEGETFCFYNEATNMYMSPPTMIDGSTVIKMTSDKNQAGVYKINIDGDPTYTNGNLVSATVKIESVDNKGTYIALTSADTKNVTAVASSSATGVQWIMTPIADVTIQYNFYSLAANMAWQYPYYLQENEGLVQDICEKYTSNHPSDDEESTTCNLADGIYTTCFTSDENDNSEEHWLQAELDTPASNFYFYIKANLRRADARPTKITVSGSNDGVSFTKIGETIETGLGDALFFSSDEIKCGTAYKYLRFTVNEVNEGGRAFSISEFYIMPVSDDVEHCVGTIKKFYTTAMYDEALRVPASDLIALESQYYLDKNTVAGGQVTATGATPVPGQYRQKERDELQTALNNYNKQTTDENKYTYGKELAGYLEAFKNSICSPLFIISAAWEDGYSNDWGINCDPTTDEFTIVEANEWDLRQWFGIQGHKSSAITETMNSIQLRSAINNTKMMNAQHSSIELIPGWNSLYKSERDAFAVRLYNAPDYIAADEYMEIDVLHELPTTTSNRNGAWYFTYVGASSQIYGLDTSNSEHMAVVDALARFGEVYKTAKFYYENYDESSTKLGKYHYTAANSLTKAAFDALYNDATYYYNLGAASIMQDYLDKNTGGYTPDGITSFVASIEAHFANFHLNTPPAGYYYRIRGRVSLNYLQSGITSGALAMGAITDASGNINDAVAATSVFYAVNGSESGAMNLLSFNTGRYLKVANKSIKEDDLPLDNNEYYSQNNFLYPSRTNTEGYFAWVFYDNTQSKKENYLYDNITTATTATDVTVDASNANNKRYDWTIELVTELPVEVSAARMTSLCVPVELEIPDGVTAYILTGKEIADGNHLYAIDYETYTPGTEVFNVEPIKLGIIPAGMPVLIKAEEGVHYFPINYDAEDADKDDALLEEIADLEVRNRLEGTHDARLISERAGIQHHILSKKNNKVGMFKVKMVSEAERGLGYVKLPTFINQAHRAWLPYSAAVSASGFSFAVGGKGHDTTNIDEITIEREENDAIYDLQGRKLEGISSPGFYIVNGKKIIVK